MADRFNKKRVIIYCDIVSIALFVISGFLPLSIFSICVLLVGAFFQTLEGPAYQALVADITPAEKREKAFSLLYLGANIGLILSPTLAGLLFKDHLNNEIISIRKAGKFKKLSAHNPVNDLEGDYSSSFAN